MLVSFATPLSQKQHHHKSSVLLWLAFEDRCSRHLLLMPDWAAVLQNWDSRAQTAVFFWSCPILVELFLLILVFQNHMLWESHRPYVWTGHFWPWFLELFLTEVHGSKTVSILLDRWAKTVSVCWPLSHNALERRLSRHIFWHLLSEQVPILLKSRLWLLRQSKSSFFRHSTIPP